MTTFTALKGLALAAAAAGFVALAPAGASAAPINPAPLAAQDDANITLAHYWGGGGYGYGHRYWGHRHHGWHHHRRHHWHGHHHHRHYGFYPRFRAYYY